MNKPKIMTKMILILLLGFGCVSSVISDEISGTIATGWGTRNIVPLRLNLQQTVTDFWNPDPERIWPFKGYVDGSFYYLSSNQKPTNRVTAQHLKGFTVGGFFRFFREPTFLDENAWPYIDVGLGAGWLSQGKIAGRNLGMHFQFESKLGAGIRIGSRRQFDIGYRYTNFSNGFLKHPNATINLHMIVLGYWYQM